MASSKEKRMKLRLAFTLGLLICLCGMASSNDRVCPGHKAHLKVVSHNPAESEYHTLLINKLLYI
jgi:hypothetical protein